MSGAQSPVAENDPMMIAWKAWLGSEEGRNATKWGSAISVSIVDNQSTVSHPHLQGALWGAFVAGYQSKISSEAK